MLKSQELLKKKQAVARKKSHSGGSGFAAELPASKQSLATRVRNRLVDACSELDLDVVYVVRQFNSWQYPEKDVKEIDGWDQPTFLKHARALALEAEPARVRNMTPHCCKDCRFFVPGTHAAAGMGECTAEVSGKAAWWASLPLMGIQRAVPPYPLAQRLCGAFEDIPPPPLP